MCVSCCVCLYVCVCVCRACVCVLADSSVLSQNSATEEMPLLLSSSQSSPASKSVCNPGKELFSPHSPFCDTGLRTQPHPPTLRACVCVCVHVCACVCVRVCARARVLPCVPAGSTASCPQDTHSPWPDTLATLLLCPCLFISFVTLPSSPPFFLIFASFPAPLILFPWSGSCFAMATFPYRRTDHVL